MTWATEELKTIDLGDARRNRRLVKIVEDLAASPEASIPKAMKDAAAVQGVYDFFNNPRIKPEAIIAAHRESTVERAQQQSVVLAIQDTTQLDYSSHDSCKGKGKLIRKNTSGWLLHTVFCASSSGVPLGVLHQRFWSRQKKSKAKDPRTLPVTAHIGKRDRETGKRYKQK